MTATYRTRTARISPAQDQHASFTKTSDSSDDDDLAPIKLSAEAQAILGEEQSQADKENIIPYHQISFKSAHENIDSRTGRTSLTRREDGSPAPRVVRIAQPRPSPPSVLARDGSFAYKIHDKSKGFSSSLRDSRTPAAQLGRIRVQGSRSGTRSPHSSNASAKHSSEHDGSDYKSPEEESFQKSLLDDKVTTAPYTIARPKAGEKVTGHSTLRTSRIGAGRFLNGPVRRGVIRRTSDDGEDVPQHKESELESPEVQQGRKAEPALEDRGDDLLIEYDSPAPAPKNQPSLAQMRSIANLQQRRSKSPELQAERPRSLSRPAQPSPQLQPVKSTNIEPAAPSARSYEKPVFRIPSLPPLEHNHDQENEPPPTFNGKKQSHNLLEPHNDGREPAQRQALVQLMPQTSPARQPLLPHSNNTPHRPAPAPPPKMSLLETATSTAGNSRTKKSVHYVLNGRTYRRLDPIGRGGSSRVFRIMAENYKIFALKRVNLEEADMAAIAGYKGEIELLKKLSNVDRVVRLFDHEVNEEKGILNVLMELGETDFNKMLNEQLKSDTSTLDISFTRHYWKEMLECVRAVHEHDIVHSDLKPANFLLVKGQLKLIDFGIANAIQDNTVNVHRENQIGTPNYMSPESLVCHTPMPGSAPGTKLLKLGKPSDVWSLGCILYQMTYGQPPFAHITKQFERIMSIPNPKVEISFPNTGIGGSVVPFGLIKTLRRCLQRDQTLRPSVDELLSPADPFLNPIAISPDMLGRVIGNVVNHCRKREEQLKASGDLGKEGFSVLPRDEEMRGWSTAFYDKLRIAQEEGTAW